MPKKSKKAEAQTQDANNAAKENVMEVTSTDVQEVVPATIVEASEAVVFHSQTEGQEIAAPAEKPASKPRLDRRPYIPFLTEALQQPQDRKSLLKTIMEKWPTVSKGGCQTFLTDMLNRKYSFFKDRAVIKLADGKVVFADKAPIAEKVQETSAEPSPAEAEAPAADVVVPAQGEQPGQPAE